MTIGIKQKLSDGSWYPLIPLLCQCGCGEIMWSKYTFKRGHNYKTNEGKNLIRMINKGRKFSEEHRRKLGLAQIGNKKAIGHKLEGNSKERSSKTMFGNGKIPWNKGLIGVQSKEKHPLWKGGTSFLPYCEKFDRIFKESIRLRDNYTCQLCGITQEENGRKLDVHHIHHDKSNCYPDCIALCRRCNLHEVEKKDKIKYYEELFMNKLNDRQLLFWTKRNIFKDK